MFQNNYYLTILNYLCIEKPVLDTIGTFISDSKAFIDE